MAQNWFKHDYNAKSDDKILELRAKHGWRGYGLFWAFIERMAESETGAIDPDRIGGLSIDLNISKEELQTFIDTCLEVDLFYKDEAGLLRNSRITAHVEKMQEYKEAGRKGAKKRWSKHSDRGAIRGANGNPNADKSRVDEIRTKAQYTDKDTPNLSIKEGEDFSNNSLIGEEVSSNV